MQKGGDKKQRKEVEERNEADSLAYQVERQVKELGESLPVHEKARLEQTLNDLKQALKDNAPIDKIRTLHSDLQQSAHSLSEAAYQQTKAGPGEESSSEQTAGSGDDVVDAEFEEKQG